MKQGYKKIIILIIFAAALTLSGCAKVVVTAKIDNNYNTSYTIDGYVETSRLKAQEIESIVESLNNLVIYYNEKGYDANMSKNGSELRFHAERYRQCASYTECFDTLNVFMTSDTSPLKTYSYDLNQHHFYYDYAINGSVDTNNLVSSSAYSALPEEIREEVNQKLAQCDFHLVFNMPDHVDLSVDSSTNNVTTIMVPINDVTEFNVNGKINNDETLKDSKEYVDKAKYYKNLTIVFGSIIVVLLAVAIFARAKLKPKKKKYNKY